MDAELCWLSGQEVIKTESDMIVVQRAVHGGGGGEAEHMGWCEQSKSFITSQFSTCGSWEAAGRGVLTTHSGVEPRRISRLVHQHMASLFFLEVA